MNMSTKTIWEAQLREQESSGLSALSWCSQHQIKPHAFYYWRKKIKQDHQNSQIPVFAEVTKPTSLEAVSATGLSVTVDRLHLTIRTSDDIWLATQLLEKLQLL